jgi:hypothetical protein
MVVEFHFPISLPLENPIAESGNFCALPTTDFFLSSAWKSVPRSAGQPFTVLEGAGGHILNLSNCIATVDLTKTIFQPERQRAD